MMGQIRMASDTKMGQIHKRFKYDGSDTKFSIDSNISSVQTILSSSNNTIQI